MITQSNPTDTAINTQQAIAVVGQQVAFPEEYDLVWDCFQVDLLIPSDVEDVDAFVSNTVVDSYPGYSLVEWWVPGAVDEF